MTNWAEIKNLASQLKSVQAAESANFISERTCVDILSYLLSSGRLNVIHSRDGRSLMTNKELDKEILEELEAHGGHVSLLEIASNLDVDFSDVESRAQEIVSARSEDMYDVQCLLVGGDLLNKTFVRKIAEEIKDRLNFRGFINIIELTRMYTFPPSFIMGIISDYNGKLFKIHLEGDKYYTDAFLSKLKAQILGFFAATVIPTTITFASSKLDIPIQLLTSLVDNLISNSKLQGSLTSSRSIYSPLCYSCAQEAYIKSFFAQSGCIELNLVKSIGISDPISYLHSHFPNTIHSNEFSISDTIVSQVKALITEESDENAWIDVTQYLPHNFGPKDREWLISPMLKNSKFSPLVEYSFLFPKDSIDSYILCFDEFIRDEAALAATTQRQAYKSVDSFGSIAHISHGKIASEKKTKPSGIGGRAREIKTKNVKKKYLKKNHEYQESSNQSDNEDSEMASGEYLPREKLFSILSSHMTDEAPEELVDGILDVILPDIHSKFISLMKSIFLQNSETSRNRDRFLSEKDSLVSALLSIQLLERGALAVDDVNLRQQLLRHLIRSDVSTFVNQLLVFLAQNYDVEWPNAISAPATTMQKAPRVTKAKGGRRGKKNKKSFRGDSDDEEQQETEQVEEQEEIAGATNVVSTPSEITSLERDALVILLRQLSSSSSSSEPTSEAADLVVALNARLRGNHTDGNPDNGLPLDEIFSLCDNLASSHLGINLSVSVLRSPRSDSKRKRQDRTLALNLASQTEQQLVTATDEASVALAASALFGHALVGWPLLVHGKLVPQLSLWIQARLKSNSGADTVYPGVLKELKACKAGDDLNALKDVVLLKARKNEEVMISDEDLTALIKKLKVAAINCSKTMHSGVA